MLVRGVEQRSERQLQHRPEPARPVVRHGRRLLGDGLSRFHLGTLGGRFVSSRGSAITCVFRHITTLAEESGTVDVSEPEDQLRRHAIRLLGAKD